MACINLNFYRKSPEFQALVEHYQEKHYSDEYLARALQNYISYYDKSADYIPTNPQEKAAFTRFLENQSKVRDVTVAVGSKNAQSAEDVLRIYDTINRAFTVDELENRVQYIVRAIEAQIDAKVTKDFTGRTRQELIASFSDGNRNGLRVLLDDVKARFEENMKVYREAVEDEYTKTIENAEKVAECYEAEGRDKNDDIANAALYASAYEKVLAHWDRIAALAAIRLGEIEGFMINMNTLELQDVKDSEDMDSNEGEQEENTDDKVDNDGIDKSEGSKGERYQDYRLTKLMSSITPELKRELANLKMFTDDGKIIRDDIGLPKFNDPRQTVVIFRRAFSQAQAESPYDIDSVIDNVISEYPTLAGIKKLIERKPRVKTMLYCACRGVRQKAVFTNYDGYTCTPTQVNSAKGGNGIYNRWATRLRGGDVLDKEFSIYTFEGKVASEEQLDKARAEFFKRLRPILLIADKFNMSGDMTPGVTKRQKEDIMDNYYTLERKKEKLTRRRLKMYYEDSRWHRWQQNEKEYRLKGINPQDLPMSTEDEMWDYADKFVYGELTGLNDTPRELRREDVYNMRAALVKINSAWGNFFKWYPNIFGDVVKCLRACGLEATEEQIRHIALTPVSDKDRNRFKNRGARSNYLYYLADMILNMPASFNNSKDNLDGGFNYMLRTGHLNRDITYILSKFGSTLGDMEDRYINEGKSMSSYTQTNLQYQTLEHPFPFYEPINASGSGWDEKPKYDLPKDGKFYTKIGREFLRYEGFAVGKGENMVYGGWMETLMHEIPPINLYNCIGFNHVPYEKLSRRQKQVNSLVQFFNAPEYLGHGIELCIQGDYSSAYNFAGCPLYTEDEVVDTLTIEVLIEIERMAAIQERLLDPNRVKLPLYEKKGLEFQIFPNLNRPEIKEKLLQTYKESGTSEDARAIIAEYVRQELEKIIARDFKTIEESKALSYPGCKKMDSSGGLNLFSKTDKIDDIPSIDKKVTWNRAMNYTPRELLRLYSLNMFVHRQQATKFFAGGLENFKDIVDFEKRSVMQHMPMSPVDHEAMYEGEHVLNDTENVVIIDDPVVKSKFYDFQKQLLEQLVKDKLISEEQKERMLKSYEAIKTTDGQGLRTLSSHRAICIGFGDWSERHEKAYRRIMEGNPSASDLQVVMETVKPRYAGFEHIPAAKGELQKPIRLPVMHKYSEQVLLPSSLAKHGVTQALSVPFQALAEVAEEVEFESLTADEYEEIEVLKERIAVMEQQVEEKTQAISGMQLPDISVRDAEMEYYDLAQEISTIQESLAHDRKRLAGLQRKALKPGKIDLFLFQSNVKVGSHSVVRPFVKWSDIKGENGVTDEQARIERGWAGQDLGDYVLTSKEAIKNHIKESIATTPSTIHRMPLKYFGKAAELKSHGADDKISVASQAEKVAWANIQPGDTLEIDGKTVSSLEARAEYYKIKAAETAQLFAELRRLFHNPNELAKILYEEIATRPYTSPEVAYMLSHVNDEHFTLVPLYLPSVEHEVQQILSSIIKKRVTKKRHPGTAIVQETGFGMDLDVSRFDNKDALSEDDKLGIDYEGSGETLRIKSVDVFIPLTDSRLLQFADAEGGISPARLRELVAEGIIDENILKFIAYRTPSDAEHSVIPCKVKGFTKAVAGSTIIMPKEIMDLTGHDYDGDKMRCHFNYFDIIKPKGAKSKEALGEKTSEEKARAVAVEYDFSKSPLQQSAKARANGKLALMYAEITSPAGSRRMSVPGGCDETTVMAQTMQIIKVAAVGSQSREALILAIMDEVRKSPKYADMPYEDLYHICEDYIDNTHKLYHKIVNMPDKGRENLLSKLNAVESPFTATHAADAFDNIMAAAEMIGIYAMFNSAFQMLQRCNITYHQKKTDKGNDYELSLFGVKPGKLCAVRNCLGQLGSLTLARMLNAGVDNTKLQILGYLNQSPQLANITFFLVAMGLTEQHVHIFMNQPAIVEMNKRMKDVSYDGFKMTIELLSQEIKDQCILPQGTKFFPYTACKEVGKWDTSYFIDQLHCSPSSLLSDADGHALDQYRKDQLQLLQVLSHIHETATVLSDIVRKTRPDSDNGTFGGTIQSIIAKQTQLDDLRRTLKDCKTLSGMESVLHKVEVHEGWDAEYTLAMTNSELPEVTVLNSLMLDNSLSLFSWFFPSAKPSWKKAAVHIARRYKYSKVQEGTLNKIQFEMLLFKLLEDKRFVSGDCQAEQERIMTTVPQRVTELRSKIREAVTHPTEENKYLRQLDKNAFLNFLEVFSPRNNTLKKLRMNLRGAAAEGTKELVRSAWGELIYWAEGEYLDADSLVLENADKQLMKEVKQLACDIFKYCIFSNGLQYGMYEFAHFVPLNVVFNTPGYIDAMRDILDTTWNDEKELNNFEHQYIRNHWGDKKFLTRLNLSDWKKQITSASENYETFSIKLDEQTAKKVAREGYVVASIPNTNPMRKKQVQLLYRTNDGIHFTKIDKLGYRTTGGQVGLQYNPNVDHNLVKSIFAQGALAWEQDLENKFLNRNDINAANPRAQEYDEMQIAFRKGTKPLTAEDAAAGALRALGVMPDINAQPTAQKVESDVEVAAIENVKIDAPNVRPVQTFGAQPAAQQQTSTPTATPTAAEATSAQAAPASEQMTTGFKSALSAFGISFSDDMSIPADAVVQTDVNDDSEESQDRPVMLQLVRVDKENGVVTEKVPATTENIREARKQKAFVELNKRLREILRQKGIDVGVIDFAEAALYTNGKTIFDTAKMTANGLIEMIQLAEGQRGEEALPEEFAHVAIELLGTDHPLVQRLLDVLDSNEDAFLEAFDNDIDLYEQYKEHYKGDEDMLLREAAGKILAKALIRQQEIETYKLKGIVRWIIDAVKNVLRKIGILPLKNAIAESEDISSSLAKGILTGQLIDDMSLQNVTQKGTLFNKKKEDISEKHDIISTLLKVETKRLSIYTGRDKRRDGRKSTPTIATEVQIRELQKAITTHKVEESIVSYIEKSMEFLAEQEKKLDAAVETYSSANDVCRRLNTLRESLRSFIISLDAVEQAVADGELGNTVVLSACLQNMSTVLNKLDRKYNKLALRYFEGLLADVYGEKGHVKTVGKEKGRVVSIHEMATRADHDLSFMSRLFNAAADCNDYVLKAVDTTVQNAKFHAHSRSLTMQKRIQVAFDKLYRETGSKDQSFMFEMKLDDSGNRVRTGRYIDAEAAFKLPTAQREFWKEMIEIKRDLSRLVPQNMISNERNIVMVRKSLMEKFSEKDTLGDKMSLVFENIKNSFLEDHDISSEEFVYVDFDGNVVDYLPLKFLRKGDSESYEDMTDDVASSMLMFANMAYEYAEMNNIIAVLENAKFMSLNRDVAQSSNGRRKLESIETSEYTYSSVFTVKQAQTQAMKALLDYFQMHIYGHIKKDEGTIPGTRVSKRKLIDTVNRVASLSQMALNSAAQLNNLGAGLTTMYVQSSKNSEFTADDLRWGAQEYMKETGDRLAQTGKQDVDNKLSLFAEKFDLHQDYGKEKKNFRKGRLSRIFNTSLLYLGLTAGEDVMALTTGLAVARNTILKDADGNDINLYDAYEVKYVDEENKIGAHLQMKEGVTKQDGTPFTIEDEFKYSRLVANENFQMQGIYNKLDRSPIQQYAFGSLIIMYKKWLAPAFKRRYGAAQINTRSGKDEEGYFNTAWHLIYNSFIDAKKEVTEEDGSFAVLNIIEDVKAYMHSFIVNYENLSDYEKANMTKAFKEVLIYCGLFLATSLLLRYPPERENEDGLLAWTDHIVLAQMLRLRNEIGTLIPGPSMVEEGLRLFRSPFAAAGPIFDALNTLQLLIPSNYVETIKSGPFRGRTKAYRYFRNLPIISMFKKVDNFIDPTYTITYYAYDPVI